MVRLAQVFARVPYYRPATHAPQTGLIEDRRHRQASELAHPESDPLLLTPSLLPSGDPIPPFVATLRDVPAARRQDIAVGA